jgi:hypothetical protein
MFRLNVVQAHRAGVGSGFVTVQNAAGQQKKVWDKDGDPCYVLLTTVAILENLLRLEYVLYPGLYFFILRLDSDSASFSDADPNVPPVRIDPSGLDPAVHEAGAPLLFKSPPRYQRPALADETFKVRILFSRLRDIMASLPFLSFLCRSSTSAGPS